MLSRKKFSSRDEQILPDDRGWLTVTKINANENKWEKREGKIDIPSRHSWIVCIANRAINEVNRFLR